MNCRALAGIAIVASCGFVRGSADEIVEIRLNEQRFTDPATVRLFVAVEPDARNQTLRVAADSIDMYSASDVTLNGANEKRLHYFEFKNLQAGDYTLRASVFSGDKVRGMTQRSFRVVGSALRHDTR